MRKPIIAGNWKMNKTPSEARELVSALVPLVQDAKCDVVVCTPAVDFAAVSEVIKGTNIKLGAENMHWKESGAYTGELSAAMLKESGVEYVILGHSERRQYFGETDTTVNQRVLAAVKAGLTPIICVGEKKEEREAGYTNALVTYQTQIALSGLTADEVKNVVIAYEPVWAIGTGLTATDEQANETIGVIREAVRAAYGDAADDVRIQYGGSMNPKNCKGLMAQPEIDGGLIGGASQGGGLLQGCSFRRVKEQLWLRNLFCFASWTASAGCRSRRSATRLRRPGDRTSTACLKPIPIPQFRLPAWRSACRKARWATAKSATPTWARAASSISS